MNRCNIMEELPDACLPYQTNDDKKTRDTVYSIAATYWKLLNKWTAASNKGLHHLKSAVGMRLNLKDDELSMAIHAECLPIDSTVEFMKKQVKVMFDLLEELKTVMNLQENIRPGSTFESLVSTTTLKTFYELLSKIAECCSEETDIKIHACKPLAHTSNEETLNACITLWTNSLHILQPHLYHIKILMLEVQGFDN